MTIQDLDPIVRYGLPAAFLLMAAFILGPSLITHILLKRKLRKLSSRMDTELWITEVLQERGLVWQHILEVDPTLPESTDHCDQQQLRAAKRVLKTILNRLNSLN